MSLDNVIHQRELCVVCKKKNIETKMIKHEKDYTCPICGYKEDIKPRDKPNKGITVEYKKDESKFIMVYPEQSLIVYGMSSPVYLAYGKDDRILTATVTSFQVYLDGLEVAKDKGGHGLNALYNEYEELEKNLIAIKNGRAGRPPKK